MYGNSLRALTQEYVQKLTSTTFPHNASLQIGMDADYHQPGTLIVFSSGFHVRQFSQGVDAGIRPKADEHDFPSQRLTADRNGRRLPPARHPYSFQLRLSCTAILSGR